MFGFIGNILVLQTAHKYHLGIISDFKLHFQEQLKVLLDK